RSEAYFVFPLAQGTPGKQCGLAATGDYQPSLRSPWLAAVEKKDDQPNPARTFWPFRAQWKQDFTDYLDCRGTGDH
uniref:hypothetical protein n=1 Tax=Thiolapillus sp. TaxID=2017437 RepID=UPI003AF85770